MANIIVERSYVQMTQEFDDGDTRLITLDNPKATITPAQVQDLSDFMLTNNITIGDKQGAAFTRLRDARKVTSTTTIYDLT